MHKKRRIVHNTIKKKLRGVAEADAPFIEFAWSDISPDLTWLKWYNKMKKKYGDDFTVHPYEDSEPKKESDKIKAILEQVSDPAVKEALELLFEDRLQP